MTVRNWITKLLKASNKVEQTFYVSERDKGDIIPDYQLDLKPTMIILQKELDKCLEEL